MKSVIKKSLFAVMLASGFSSAAWAAENEGPKYSYVEGGALRADFDGANAEYGAALRGGWAISDMWHVDGEVKHVSIEDFDVTSARVAFGLNTAVSDRSDLVLRAGFEHVRVSASGSLGDVSESGATLEIGLRSALTEHLEASIGARHSFLGEGSNVFVVGGQYKFTNGWAVTTDVEFDDAGNQIFLGARKYF